jgi:hypothetical protein
MIIYLYGGTCKVSFIISIDMINHHSKCRHLHPIVPIGLSKIRKIISKSCLGFIVRLFCRIKKDLGFSAISRTLLSSVPWPLYVMALSKNLIPDSKPEFFKDNVNDGRVTCNICSITFTSNEKDQNGMTIIQNVQALYKLHKSVSHMIEYSLCLACFYALQNPATAADYPKDNRKDPKSEEYYTHTFQMLKRNSDFGYLGEIKIGPNNTLPMLCRNVHYTKVMIMTSMILTH